MLLYRDHRGGYKESMETVRSIKGKDDILSQLEDKGELIVEPYSGIDMRNGWNTHIVKQIYPDGRYYPVGFTNGMLS